MSFCSICGKYAHGNKYCYNCYQETVNKIFIEKNISRSYANTCLKCNKTINEIGYCLDCYKNKIVEDPTSLAEEYYKTSLFDTNNTKYHRHIEKKTANRRCIYCDKKAKLGSHFCEDHYQTFIIEEQTKYYEHLEKIYKEQEKKRNLTKYIKTDSKNRICQICGACSYNMPFCKSCYSTFIKEDGFDFINQFEDEKIYTCKSGIKVRSLSERDISDFLTENNVPHVYEQELKYKFFNFFQGREYIKSLHPDFYIPGPVDFKGRIIKNVYIEFWGFDEDSNNVEYINTKKFKIKNYIEMGITLINTDKTDLNNVSESLTYKLLNYKNNKVNY